jgi:hypothetical protein
MAQPASAVGRLMSSRLWRDDHLSLLEPATGA